MALTDQEFREAYKPLEVSSHYDVADTLEKKVIFALSLIGEGNADAIAGELEKLEPGILNDQNVVSTTEILNNLYNKGLLNGHQQEGITFYNLHKITEVNRGDVNPDLLAPGLD